MISMENSMSDSFKRQGIFLVHCLDLSNTDITLSPA